MIPDYESAMRPLLEFLSDGHNRTLAECREWKEVSRAAQVQVSSTDGSPNFEAAPKLPPDESLDFSFRRYREAVQSELVDLVKSMPPEFFERLVVDLLLRLGYGGPFGSGLHLGRTGDRGIDGVINQDKLGLDLLYVQAKRWQDSVGAPIVREFAGALSAHRARKGVIITTSWFTRDAQIDAERMGERIVLIDGATLAELMYDTGLGLSTYSTFELKRVDSDYFGGES